VGAAGAVDSGSDRTVGVTAGEGCDAGVAVGVTVSEVHAVSKTRINPNPR
jgi:hypothetical protein